MNSRIKEWLESCEETESCKLVMTGGVLCLEVEDYYTRLIDAVCYGQDAVTCAKPPVSSVLIRYYKWAFFRNKICPNTHLYHQWSTDSQLRRTCKTCDATQIATWTDASK